MADEGFNFTACRRIGAVDNNFRFKKIFVRYEFFNRRLRHAVHEDLHQTVGQLEHLQNLCNGSFAEDIFLPRLIDGGVFLHDEKYVFPAIERCIGCTQRGLASHKDGKNHIRKNHDIPQRQNRKDRRNFIQRFDLLGAFYVFIHTGKTLKLQKSDSERIFEEYGLKKNQFIILMYR